MITYATGLGQEKKIHSFSGFLFSKSMRDACFYFIFLWAGHNAMPIFVRKHMTKSAKVLAVLVALE